MNKLERLIEQLCPNGVEHKSLGEIAEYSKARIPISKITVDEYIGVENLLQNKAGRTTAASLPNTDVVIAFERDDILVGNIRPYLRKIWLADCNGGTNGDVLTIHINDKTIVIPRFLYYVLSSEKFFFYDIQNSKGAKMPRGDKAAVMRYVCPIPPLEVQAEIVRILDKFTELTTELATELANRKKQYEYYRDNLLSFATSIPVKRIGEITKVFSAARVHKGDWTAEGVPFFRSSDVISAFNGEANPRGKAFISYDLYKRLSQKSGRFEKDDILITGGGTIGIPYIIPTDNPLYVKDADLICVKKNDFVRSRFLYHYFLSNDFRKYLKNITHDATIAHYTITQIENTPIPVPSLSTQDRLINVLDNLEAICSDLNSGLPAEIEARQKQYEYYRDKLLTFKRIEKND